MTAGVASNPALLAVGDGVSGMTAARVAQTTADAPGRFKTSIARERRHHRSDGHVIQPTKLHELAQKK